MAQAVVTMGNAICSMGTNPSILNGTSNLKVLAEGKPLMVITDATAGVNIVGFGMCTSLANPAVAAATTAALGVLTPMPCVPAVTGAWIPNNVKVLVGGQPCLTLGACCVCMYGGKIDIINPGQIKVSAG